MQFSSEEYAKECLSHISYFRLKYYWTDMIDIETEHDFLEGAFFDDVIARYNFDCSLRLILFDAIEIIEVALRAKIINYLSQAKDRDFGIWMNLSLKRWSTMRTLCLTSSMSLSVVRSPLPKNT